MAEMLIHQLYLKLGSFLYRYARIRNLMPDKMYLQQFFAHSMGYYMDFDDPKTFNEKLHWLKLYDHNPLYSTLVDKQAVKSWVSETIGEEFVIPTLKVYRDVNEIHLEDLPGQFVLKCTHDSGSVVVCRNKKELTKPVLDSLAWSLNQDYYMLGREWPYKNVPHRIIAEPYLSDDLKDYKFFCFNSKVRLFKVDFDRMTNHHANYYDREANLMCFGEIVCPPDFEKHIEIPDNLSKMIDLAERLAGRIKAPFIRIDLYNLEGSILFGEATFFPAGGHGRFTEAGWDEKLGSWIDI